MLYLFHGSDVEKARTKAFEWVAAARKKEPNLAYVRLAREELTPAALEDAASSGGLFVSRLLILIDDPYVGRGTSNMGNGGDEGGNEGGNEEVATPLDDYIDALAASDNAIIILAPKLLATKAKKLVAKAKMEYKFDLRLAPSASRGFNATLVDALGARNREKLWLEINRALRLGDAPEMLHGLLHWKVRDLMAKGSRTWPPAEARSLSLALIDLLQESRRGGLDLSLSLERFALSI